VVTTATTSEAANIQKTNNATSLDQGASWVGGIAPGTSDLAVWDSTVSTAANCTNTLAAPVSWGGIQVSNPAVAVKVQTNGLAVGTGISVGSLGITLTNGTSLWLAPAFTTTADQNWTIANGLTLELGEASRIITVANNVTINGAVAFPYNIKLYGSLTIPSGSTLTSIFAASTEAMDVGTASGAGVVNQTGGTVTVLGKSGGSSGSPNASMIIGFGGTYNISGGSLIDGS